MDKINNLNHSEKIDRQKIHYIHIVSFLMGLGSAIFIYIISSYFKVVLGTDNVGVIYFFAYLIILVSLLNLHKIIFVFGKSYIFHVLIFLKILAVLGLIFVPVSFAGIFFMILYIVVGTLAWSVINSILESFSLDRESGRIRGANLSIIGAGFLMGPFLSTQLLENYNFQGVFWGALIVYFLIFIISMFFIKKTNHKFVKKIKVRELCRAAMKRKDIMRIYSASFALEFFYALMVIYVPLYLLSRGFSWEQLGLTFTIILIPFVLTQYPIGLLADKKTGEKELLVFSLFILGVSVLLLYFIDSENILVWTAVLLLGRTGAASVEILRDSYFFKRIDGGDVDVIDFFATASPVAFICATAISSVLLIFFPLPSIFLLVAFVCFVAILPTLKLCDNKALDDLK